MQQQTDSVLLFPNLHYFCWDLQPAHSHSERKTLLQREGYVSTKEK